MSQEEHSHHIIPFKMYAGIYATLLFLTIITVAAAQFDFGGALNITLAMLIATVKAAFVVMYFMHLKYDTTYNRAIFTSAVICVFLLYIFCVFDMLTRKQVILGF